MKNVNVRGICYVVAALCTALASAALSADIVRVPGVLEAGESVDIKSDVASGTTTRFIVPEGKKVKKGTLLVKLDPSRLEQKHAEQLVQIENAELRLTEAEADFVARQEESQVQIEVAELASVAAEKALASFLAEGGEFGLQVKETDAEIDLAKKRIEVMTKRRERIKQMGSGDEVNDHLEEVGLMILETQTQLGIATARRRFLTEHFREQKVAEYRLKVAEQKLALTHARLERNNAKRSGKAALKAGMGQLAMEKSALERIKKQLAACSIKAPCAGTVVYPTVSRRTPAITVGSRVRHGQVLLKLADPKRARVMLRVRLKLAQAVTTGQKVPVRFDALPDRTFNGVISRIGVVKRPLREPVEATITIRLTDMAPKLKPGMTAEVDLTPAATE